MKDLHYRKRYYFAWFLLLVLFLHRIIGILGTELSYTVEIEKNMSRTENTIAERIKTEMGFDVHVEIYDDHQIELLLHLGYLTPFIFSEEIEGQVFYYSIDNAPKTTVEYSSVDAEQSNSPAPFNTDRTFNKRLFSDFYFWVSNFSINTCPILDIPGAVFPDFWEDPFISIPSPPPKAA